MLIQAHEWRPAIDPSKSLLAVALDDGFCHEDLYRRLADAQPDTRTRDAAKDFLQRELCAAACADGDIPQSPEDLQDWMRTAHQTVHLAYSDYLSQRKQGAPRRFFSNRAHALYFLRAAAPTKLVDGAWLYGLLPHWRNPRLSDLVRTYVEELGEGAPDKNHVGMYRALLARHGIDPVDGLPDAMYHQGLVQLALAWNAEDFLPEILGFNLAYEQLPLHLLITAYELNELGIDPYYFTLHVTVDNGDTGHARRACQAVLDNQPRLDDGGVFWARVRRGGELANAGVGTSSIIADFDIDKEMLRILTRKAHSGSGAHSDYCRVAGRSVNEWLAEPHNMPAFLGALEQAGWIRRGEPAVNSRFWNLLQGERADMFGVFSGYELQLIHDWIRGPDSADGMPYAQSATANADQRPRTFRAAQRPALRTDEGQPDPASEPLDADWSLIKQAFQNADEAARNSVLIQAMSPALHWTPAGLCVTRLFWRRVTDSPVA